MVKEIDKQQTKRKEQAINTKNNLLQAAKKLVTEKRFDQITIDEIRKEAGVSIGTFYHHFKSKDEIFSILFSKIDKELFDDFHQVNNDIPSEDILINYFNTLAITLTEFGWPIVKENFFYDNIFYNKNQKLRSALLEIIIDGQSNGCIKKRMPSEELTDYLLTMARGIVLEWCYWEGTYSLKDKMNFYMEEMIHPHVM
jgi:TetR/AcrR family transcriptional regulator, fatty acid metabolism regulator protein